MIACVASPSTVVPMSQPPFSQQGLHVLAKPTGPICNIACKYCFYLKKEALYPRGESWKMSDETLRTYVRQYLESQPVHVDEIDFAFQGGEPTLMGVDFFRRVIELQKEYAPSNMRIRNSLQTNGIKLDDQWCHFLKEHNYLVGLSVDGPTDLHNKYRVDRKGEGTHAQVMRAMELMQKHGVEFNALVCVNRHNAVHPQRVYRFFRDHGVDFLQFIPIVEPRPGVVPWTPPPPGTSVEELVSERSVLSEQFGRFLIAVFEEWIHNDVGRMFVRDFDQALSAWSGMGASLCVYAETCGRAVAIEHNGDLYSCDHYVFPEFKLGNIHETPIAEMTNSQKQEQFGRDKLEKLPEYCRQCGVRFACNGGCPKDRLQYTPDGEFGLNFLCAGLKMFFEHIDPCMRFMADELKAGRPAAGIMRRLRAEEQRVRQESQAAGQPLKRNDPCPCGSGKKYKSCCMRR